MFCYTSAEIRTFIRRYSFKDNTDLEIEQECERVRQRYFHCRDFLFLPFANESIHLKKITSEIAQM